MNERHFYAIKKNKPIIHGLSYLWVMKIIAYFNCNRKIIILTDKDEQYITITYKLPCIICGKVHAPVYPDTKVGDVILEENGKIGDDSKSFFINSWEYYEKEKYQWR